MESVEDVVLGEGVSASGAATEEELFGLDDHSWLQWYQKSWLDISEGGDGRLINPDEQGEGRKGHRVRPYAQDASDRSGGGIAIKKGLIRFLYIIVDFSQCMRQTDYKPTRYDYILSELCDFIESFFQQNPLSYISLIAMREGSANFITRMNGQPNFQIKKLREYIQSNHPSGSCSLVKAIDLVLKSGEMPLYASREVLVVWGSLSSVDNPQTPIHPYLTERISSSGGLDATVVSMSPEVFAVKRLSTQLLVAISPPDFRNKLTSLLQPKNNAQAKPVYIKMGFPMKSVNCPLTKCSCHLELHSTLYSCPQCKSLACEIPTNCAVCKLTLVEKDMLTRIHRLLYEMPRFEEISTEGDCCQGCSTSFASKEGNRGVQCTECGEIYCYDCDAFAHEKLRHCFGCLSRG